MAKFSYRARNHLGEVVNGEVEAPERRDAKRMVTQLHLIPIDVELLGSDAITHAILPARPKAGWTSPLFRRKVSGEELMFLFQQLQTIYAVGVPLLRGLELVRLQCEHPELKEALGEIGRRISEGHTLADSLEKFPRIFDSVTINLVRAGESSGQMDEMLERIAQLLQLRMEQRSKVKAATFYPKIVLGFIGVVFFVVVYFVIPKFESFFGRFGGELPAVTRYMLGLSKFMVSYWWLIFGLVLAGHYAFTRFLAHPEGRKKWDALMLKTPVFGVILLHNDLLSFCSIFEMLIRSGIPITEALPIVRRSLANTQIQDDVDRMKAGVEAGQTLSDSLAQSQHMPKAVTGLIGIGEEAGALERTLQRLSQFYRMQLDYRLANLAKAIEPVLLFFVFGLVLLLALSVFLPMWRMNSVLKR